MNANYRASVRRVTARVIKLNYKLRAASRETGARDIPERKDSCSSFAASHYFSKIRGARAVEFETRCIEDTVFLSFFL